MTGAAAAALDRDGRFVLPQDAGVDDGAEIGAGLATALAAAYVKNFGPQLLRDFESQRGGPIDISTLAPCGRAYHATSPYEDPGAGASAELRVWLGSQWLVTLCTPGGVPTVTVAVSALATELRIESGEIKPSTGQYFFADGIPERLPAVPLPPEEAVRIAAEGTGQRVAQVPELIMPPVPYRAQLAKWRLGLEQPVSLFGQHSRESRQTQTVFVGFGESWNWSGLQDADPTLGPPPSVLDGRLSPGGSPVMVSPRLKPGLPGGFERVTVEGRQVRTTR